MARKLKSDKLLFTATVLLVCTSVVMVYSASVVYAMDKFHQPNLFLFKQATWALLGFVLMPVVMRIDYRNYRQPAVIWTLFALVSLARATKSDGTPRAASTTWVSEWSRLPLSAMAKECPARSARVAISFLATIR